MGIRSLLGLGERKKVVLDYLNKDALIIDIRHPEDFAESHMEGSTNIEEISIPDNVNMIKSTNRPVILCCSSGLKSDEASVQLKKNGIDVINGGSWRRLKKIMDKNGINR